MPQGLLRFHFGPAVLLLSVLIGPTRAVAQEDDFAKAAQGFRQGLPVQPVSETTLVCEAEEFAVDGKGWQAKPFGMNYYAATFANSFLSRQAYLGAPEQGETTSARLDVQVPKAGKYLALIRYEAPFKFEAQFRLIIEQQGTKVLDRLYGSRANLRIWAFREKLKKEVGWSWGAVENLVWEGHDADVTLAPGKATLTLVAGKQPEPAARRNVDLVMLTSDLGQVSMRIDKENYLPLDGMLTQTGDLFLKVHNRSESAALSLTVPHGIEHSPYWVHLRSWKPLSVAAKPGQVTDWVEVGGQLDTLSNGQWTLTPVAKGPVHYDVEFGLKNAAGTIETIRRFDGIKGNLELAYDGATRYSRRIRLADDVLYDLVAFLKKHPVQGTPPQRTLIYGYTFNAKPADPRYMAALEEFTKIMGATALGRDSVEELTDHGLVRGYIDVRGVPTPKLEEYCKKLQANKRADRIAVVSLGDEIGLAVPPANDHKGFRAWLATQNLKPGDVQAGAASWDAVLYTPKPETAQTMPGLYYWSKIYGFRYGIKNLKERTDILRRYLPNAGVGANFSPHHKHLYLGDTHHWISIFREEGMTMPWGEDYIWQVPVGSLQMNSIMVDMFRAGLRGKPSAKIHYYVMAHTPGNTTHSWRRQFYGDLAHGAKVLNLFEFRPVQAAYTENHVSSPAMYQEVRKSIHELGTFEDIIQDGQVVPAKTALWFSETGDVWDNHKAPFDVAKRCLYCVIRQHQVPLDFVVEGDDLKDYQTLYLCDANVSRAASQAIAHWVEAGGSLFATAGAGMFDELNQPNKTLRALLGVEQSVLLEDKQVIQFEKQDLPFARPRTSVAWKLPSGSWPIPVLGSYSALTAQGAEVLATFQDNGQPALTHRKAGKGQAWCCAFLPGLSAFKPALPLRPVDRGATDDTMAHFLPTDFDAGAKALIALPIAGPKPVHCSADLVETTLIRAKQGLVIPLINWGRQPVKDLHVDVALEHPDGQVSLASGRPVRKTGANRWTFDLDVADALIFRGR